MTSEEAKQLKPGETVWVNQWPMSSVHQRTVETVKPYCVNQTHVVLREGGGHNNAFIFRTEKEALEDAREDLEMRLAPIKRRLAKL